MSEENLQSDDKVFIRRTIEAAIQIGVLFLLVVWCYDIIKPFIIPVVWGIIITVAIYPLYSKLQKAMGGRQKLAATLYTLLALALLITPTILVTGSIVDSSKTIAEDLKQGKLVVPPPKQSVSEWPLVGEDLYKVWSQTATNLEATLKRYETQLKQVGKAIISAAAGAGATVLQFVFSIIISGILLANAQGAYKVALKIIRRLAGKDYGLQLTDLAGATIRSVATGVLGIALIQATLSAIGMIVIDVPGWGLWTMLVLVLAVAQLPPILILGPVAAYVFSYADTTPAVIFLIWSLVISMSDGFLKPLFLGRGMDTPMLVILLGAIGGMISSGIIGLFVGAIILALGYELFMAWLNRDDQLLGEQK